MRRWDGVLDLLADVLDGLLGRAARTLLLVLVFAVGSGGFVAALGISATAAQQVTQRLTPSDLDEVRLRPVIRSVDDAPASDPAGQADPGDLGLPKDVEQKAMSLPAVTGAGVVYELDSSFVISRLAPSGTPATALSGVKTLAANPAWLRLMDTTITPAQGGAQLTGFAADHVALLGTGAAKRLDIAIAGPGQAIWAGGRRFDVVGLITAGPRDPSLKDAVVISSAALKRSPAVVARPVLYLRTVPGYARAVGDVASTTLRPDRPGVLRADPIIDLRSVRRGVVTDLDRVIGMVSALVLALAGLTIANAMVVSVLFRTGEIGLRRALGASRRQVAGIFLAEGALTGLAGGVCGVALGLVTTVVVARVKDWTPVLTPGIVPVGASSAVLVGLIFSTYPAWRASRVEPAVAVRQQD